MYNMYFTNIDLPLQLMLPEVEHLSMTKLDQVQQSKIIVGNNKIQKLVQNGRINNKETIIQSFPYLCAWLELKTQDPAYIRPIGKKHNINLRNLSKEEQMSQLQNLYSKIPEQDILQLLSTGVSFCKLVKRFDVSNILNHINLNPTTKTAKQINFNKIQTILQANIISLSLPSPQQLADGQNMYEYLQILYNIWGQLTHKPNRDEKQRDYINQHIQSLQETFFKQKKSKQQKQEQLIEKIDDKIFTYARQLFSGKDIKKVNKNNIQLIQAMSDCIKKINSLLTQKFDIKVTQYEIITFLLRDLYIKVGNIGFNPEDAQKFKQKQYNLKSPNIQEILAINNALITNIINKINEINAIDTITYLQSSIDKLVNQNSYFCYQLMFVIIGIYYQLADNLDDFLQLFEEEIILVASIKPEQVGGQVYQLFAKSHGYAHKVIFQSKKPLNKSIATNSLLSSQTIIHPQQQAIEILFKNLSLLQLDQVHIQNINQWQIIISFLNFVTLNSKVLKNINIGCNYVILTSNTSQLEICKYFRELFQGFSSNMLKKHNNDLVQFMKESSLYNFYEFLFELINWTSINTTFGDLNDMLQNCDFDKKIPLSNQYLLKEDTQLHIISLDHVHEFPMTYNNLKCDVLQLWRLSEWGV